MATIGGLASERDVDMRRMAILTFFVLVTLSETSLADEEANVTTYENDSRFASFALSALDVFQQFGVSRILLRACSTSETYLWWNLINANKNVSLYTSFEESSHLNDGALIDMRCETGIKTMESVVHNRSPDSFPKMIVVASASSQLVPIFRRFNVEGRFLDEGLAVAKLPSVEFPSVLRVAVPDENMLTDPAGAVIASKVLAHLRDTLKLTLSFRRGNISDVLSGNADLVADAVPMDEKFMERAAFLGRQVWRLRSVVLMKTPGLLWDTDALLRPFSTDVWLSVGASILAVAFVLRCVAFWEGKEIDSHPKAGEEDTWSFSLMTAMGIMCAQGFTCSTKWTAGRIVLVTFEVFSLFVGLFYSSAMVTFLLTLPETNIKTAPDLVNWPLTIGVDPFYYSIPDLVQSRDSIVRTVMSLKAESMSVWDALMLANEQPVAFLSGEHLAVSTAGAALEVSTICRLESVILQPDWPLSLVGSKSVLSPWLLERFRRAVAHVAEVGMLAGDSRRAEAPPLTCLQSDVTDTEAIGFRAIWPGLAMLAIGHFLSVIILFLEISVDAWHRYKPLHSKSA